MPSRPRLDRTPRIPALVAGLLLLCAQAAAADGNGVLVGETARLHFGLDLEARYDSLAGQGGIGQDGHPVYDPADVILHLRPGVKLLAPSPTVDFEAHGLLDWAFYTAWLAPTRELSYLGLELGTGLLLGKVGPVSLALDDLFTRSDRTTNPSLGLGTLTDRNVLNARLSFRPGGGALEGAVGYNFQLEAYELNARANIGCTQVACDGTKFGSFGSQTHTFTLDSRWRFLPKTALLAEVSQALRLYDNQTVNIPTQPFRAQLGLAGLLTEKVRLLLKGGYTRIFASRGATTDGWLGLLEIGYTPIDTASVTLQGLHTIEPVSDLYGLYADWRLGLTGKLLVAGRLQLSVEGRLDRIDFFATNRTDTQATLDAQAALELRRELRLLLGAMLTTRQSTEDPVFTYGRTELYLRLTVAY